MENYENNTKTTLTADEIEQMVQRYLEKTRDDAVSEKTIEEQKIIDMIIEQARF